LTWRPCTIRRTICCLYADIKWGNHERVSKFGRAARTYSYTSCQDDPDDHVRSPPKTVDATRSTDDQSARTVRNQYFPMQNASFWGEKTSFRLPTITRIEFTTASGKTLPLVGRPNKSRPRNPW